MEEEKSGTAPIKIANEISLRDYFAGLAMSKLISLSDNDNYYINIVKHSYKIADLMLKYK